MSNEILDLIHNFKLSNAENKVAILDDIKELLLHKKPELISSTIPSLIEPTIETSANVRKALVKISGDAMVKDINIVPSVLELFEFYLSNDECDSVLKAISLEIAKLYDKIASFIVNM